jgi:hypothetical protein
MPPGPVSRAGVGQRLKLFVCDNRLIELRLIELRLIELRLIELGAVPLETDP